MTARLPGWAQADFVREVGSTVQQQSVVGDSAALPVVDLPGQLTGRMIDEAVETVLRVQDWDPAVADVLSYNLTRDVDGDVTQAYYASKVAKGRAALSGVGRRDLTIKYVLTDVEVAELTKYASNFKLRFTNRESHDHAMAAATRLIDHRVLWSKVPPSIPLSDIGGNPLVYVRAGRTGVHVCGPVVDVKDKMRHKLRQLEASKILRTAGDPLVRKMAAAVCGDEFDGFMCRRLAQCCDVQTPVLLAVHVYDVPMCDWPKIMERKGAQVVEGCVLFSDEFWNSTSGSLGVAGARYEIDVAADKFTMGFGKSPSWWYTHDWSQYMLYGADQLLYSVNSSYSYKIVERRGDTLFFRILRLGGTVPTIERSRSYKMPGVPLVKVKGFELKDDRAWAQPALRRKDYVFPAALWKEMFAQASEDFERGVLDYQKMYNHYRTISVRQTINAVLVMGGEQVSPDQLVPLVVHVCLAAAASSLLGQRETRALTAGEMLMRERAGHSTARKISQALVALSKPALLAPLLVFRSLKRFLDKTTADHLASWVLDWEPVWEVVWESAAVLMHSSKLPLRDDFSDVLDQSAQIGAVVHPLGLVMSNPKLAKVFGELCPHVDVEGVNVSNGGDGQPREVEPESRTVSVLESDSASAPPTYVTDIPDAVAEVRKEAIREHLVEIDQQGHAVRATCAKAHRALLARGVPDVGLLRSRAELYRNPDFWLVEEGVIVKSALGLPVQDFQYSAVYTPRSDSSGENIRAVHKEVWNGIEKGVQVQRDHFVLADAEYRGWVLVTDDLVIHNGPEIKKALTVALGLDHRYKVRMHQGPPGCGKTHEIIHSVVADGTDVVQCPVRESAVDTRQRLVDRFPDFPDPKLHVRTVDSYLVGCTYSDRTKDLRAGRLMADECFMAHSGKWYAAAALLGVHTLEAYGDDKQIPHIVRVTAPSLHVRLKADDTVNTYLTRRCPASAVAAWGGVYDWKVRTLSPVVVENVEVSSTVGREVPTGCVMMCMYQADKTTLRKMYSHVPGVVILTANEAEGKTYRDVWLHRFDARRRTDNFSLFDRESHVLVAMSRHTHSFVYVRPSAVGDLVSKWIALSKDSRRLAAAADVDSAGSMLEKL